MKPELERFLAAAGAARTGSARVVSLDELQPARANAARPWSLDALRGRLVELSARGNSATLSAAIDLIVEAQAQGEPVAWIMLAGGSFYPPDAADNGIDLDALAVIRVADPLGAARATERLVRSGGFGLVLMDLANVIAVEQEKGDEDDDDEDEIVEEPVVESTEPPRIGTLVAVSDRFAPILSIVLAKETDQEETDEAPSLETIAELSTLSDRAMLGPQIQGRLVTLAQKHETPIVILTDKADDAAPVGNMVSLRAAALKLVSHSRVNLNALKDKHTGRAWADEPEDNWCHSRDAN